ncbi:hypothetical protein [Herbaspirillum robiniae]|uniref:hypothetical protein n=1 Tax=Herbaspirillum robiniae TaxID=2014887 RepID=UPI003D78030C
MSTKEEWIQKAQSCFDREDFRTLITDLVNIPSPTGEEMDIAKYCANYMCQRGLNGQLQPITETQANAIGRYTSSAEQDGPELLLYANLDTHMGAGIEDHPWAGVPYPEILSPNARWNGDEISGLCAENPKGYAAIVMAAAACVAKAQIPLRGNLTVGLGAGGMAVLGRDGWKNRSVGAGNGALFMLQRGVTPDYCIVCKPVYAVSWEEVGLCFFRVRVKGAGIGYAGARHFIADPNPLPHIPVVIHAIETWIKERAERSRSGQIEPWGGISAIHSGWENRPLITPALADLIVDVRVSPRSSPAEVAREFRKMIKDVEETLHGIEIAVSLELAIPGGRTDPENWIIKTMISSWEAQEEAMHPSLERMSGYTDISVIRQWGIPAGRIGVPFRVSDSTEVDSLPMNRLHIDDAERLVKFLIRTAIETCAASLEETLK